MTIESIHFRGHRCFNRQWAGFDAIKPINVIIGRNNSGKSHMLDLVAVICSGEFGKCGWQFRCGGSLDESSLRKVFIEDSSGGPLFGDHWKSHGRAFVGQTIVWETNQRFDSIDESFGQGFSPSASHGPNATAARIEKIRVLLKQARHRLTGTIFRHLRAERNINEEKSGTELNLGYDGHGASNIVRRYILTSNPRYPREVVQKELLAALNEVFGSDARFTEIQIKTHDEPANGKSVDHWEIYLGEQAKGLVPLGNSGSGLKTVLLVLLNLLVVPRTEGHERCKYTFAFEELETHLHPALLRRLLQFIETYALKEKVSIFLTTHSSTALDVFGVSPHAQIIHVAHDGTEAKTTTVAAHFDRLGVVSELGAKPSDLLQANGIIWVEGPSDRVYLNRWIELYSDGKFKEGRDYQCAFYGGALLSRLQFTPREGEEAELVNLLLVNPNVVVVCDGDRASSDAPIKDRVSRICSEIEKVPWAFVWVAEGREIENYLPGSVLGAVFEKGPLPDPQQFESFIPRGKEGEDSYLESKLQRVTVDKVELAIRAVPLLTKEAMVNRFDWEVSMRRIIESIERWNQ